MLSSVQKNISFKTRSLEILLAIVSAVLLPQLFHAVGVISGYGAAVGAAFLPMHLPVLVAGLLCGPAVGLAAGLLSPAISFAVSGMPSAVLLPFMTVELAGYGLAAGLLSKSKMPVFCKLLIAQLSGRILRSLSVIAAVFIFSESSVTITAAWNYLAVSLPGILLQWTFIPLLLYRINGRKRV